MQWCSRRQTGLVLFISTNDWENKNLNELLLDLNTDLNICWKDIAPAKPVADGQIVLLLHSQVHFPGHLLEHHRNEVGPLGCLERASFQAEHVWTTALPVVVLTVPSGRGLGDFSHWERERWLQKQLKRTVSFLGPKGIFTRCSHLRNRQGLPSGRWGTMPIGCLMSTRTWTPAGLLKGPGQERVAGGGQSQPFCWCVVGRGSRLHW